MEKILGYLLYDIGRNRVVLGYTLLLFLLSMGLLNLQGRSDQAVLTLLNVSLLTVPLVSLIFSTTYIYNSYEFITLLLAQPLRRALVLRSELLALAIALTLAYWIGVGLPLLLYRPDVLSFWLVVGGTLLTLTFVGLAVLSAVLTHDKARGIGLSLLLWVYFALLFDSLILLLLFYFSDYPLERPTLFLIMTNPIDLARMLVLMKMDASALMGFTAAVFQDFFGSLRGTAVALLVLGVWVAVPAWWALNIFNKKDL